jgi:hypothetical protein
MKNVDVYKLGFMIALCTVCYVIIVSITTMAIFQIPTTAENSAIRGSMLELVLAMWTLCAAILGYKLRDYIEDKNKL